MNMLLGNIPGLFNDANTPIQLIQSDGEAVLHPCLLPVDESQRLFTAMQVNVKWHQDSIRLYGKTHDLPRLTAWYGDSGRDYRYSGICMRALPWTDSILEIKNAVERVSGHQFNSVLLNLYRDGRDGVAWHSDDEPELGINPVIASVSLGQPRMFKLRHKFTRQIIKTELPTGSMVLMRGACQQAWEHEVPKTTKPIGARINLTFRSIA